MSEFYCKLCDKFISYNDSGYLGEDFGQCRLDSHIKCKCHGLCWYSPEDAEKDFQYMRPGFTNDSIYFDCGIPGTKVNLDIGKKCLEVLPQYAKQILNMYYTCGWSLLGLSEFYGVDESTVEGYLSDARSLFSKTYEVMFRGTYE